MASGVMADGDNCDHSWYCHEDGYEKCRRCPAKRKHEKNLKAAPDLHELCRRVWSRSRDVKHAVVKERSSVPTKGSGER